MISKCRQRFERAKNQTESNTFKMLYNKFIFAFVLFKYTLPLELINQQNLTEWIEILKTVVDRDVPAVSGFWLLFL